MDQCNRGDAAMKIAFFGNVCNNFFQIASALREHANIDAHLFVDRNCDSQQRPESDVPALAGAYPPWIHEGQYISPATVLAPFKSSVVAELDACDGAVVSHFGPMFAPFSRKPWAFYPAGGDLTVHPFPWRFLSSKTSLKELIGCLPVGWWQRRGIRLATRVWVGPYPPFMKPLAELRVPPCNVDISLHPLILDTHRWSPASPGCASVCPAFAEARRKYRFIVFHPSRLMMRQTPEMVRTGQWKQNDLLIRAFAAFVKAAGARDACLCLIDREASGGQVADAKRLIAGLGVEEQCVWLSPPRRFGFTRNELLPLYQAADVVADDFGVGWFGSIVLEGAAMAKPVISYVDETVVRKLYPWHPLLSANTGTGVAAFLGRLYQDAEFRATCGSLSRTWVEAFHSPKAAAAIYAKSLNLLVTGEPRVGAGVTENPQSGTR